jgi:Skp family chaperone for outer membrane proteins
LFAGTFVLHAQPAPVQLAAMKVAVFNSDMLTDEKTGVKKLIVVFTQINNEFKPKRDEMVAMKKKYDDIVAQLNPPSATMDQKTIQAKMDEADNIKKTLERTQQDGQRALDKRIKELTEPIYIDINTSLQTWAKARGIDMLFDLSKYEGGMMVLNNAADITQTFINDYNAKNAGVPVKP